MKVQNGFVIGVDIGGRKIKPRRGLQIFDTRVDTPVPFQSRGRFL